MPHMEAIIHHGGIGTMGQAFAAGKPQVVLAVGADRPDNAARLQRLEVGAFIPPPLWQPETVADALRKLIESPRVRARAQELGHQVRTANAIGAACG